MQDDTPPTYNNGDVAATAPGAGTAGPGNNNIMCTWPPNFKYYCLADVFGQAGGSFIRDELLPIKDNCGTLFPMEVGPSGFSCTDTDPRCEPGAQLHKPRTCPFDYTSKSLSVWLFPVCTKNIA